VKAVISRREFCARLSLLGALAANFPAAALEHLRSAEAASPAPDWLGLEPWKTLAEVQEHLFPPGADVPGAGDIQATIYLRNTIENPAADGSDRDFIFDGVGWLNDLARERHDRSFGVLDEPVREALLRQIEQSAAGRNWLSMLVTYLLEALLADPVYGGNPDGIGWRWLDHTPGYPTPPEHKTWYRLAAPVRFQRKA
jgi:gluconate 2-dehydrogenase gamma chain